MILYHGSNVPVEHPIVGKSRRHLDFGPAFYLTSDIEQAVTWASRTTRLRGEGRPTVSRFSVQEAVLDELTVLRFEAADAQWLHYVVAHRTTTVEDTEDVVIGPVADDQTIRTVNDFIAGRFSEDIAIQLLLPQKLKDQHAVKTTAALDALIFEGVREV